MLRAPSEGKYFSGREVDAAALGGSRRWYRWAWRWCVWDRRSTNCYLPWWRWAILGAAILPSLCYLFIIFAASTVLPAPSLRAARFHLLPSALLKPMHGLDPEAYENFASFCRQDYPQYEILFAVTSEQDPSIPVIHQIIADFPQIPIRLVVGPRRSVPTTRSTSFAPWRASRGTTS